ncbi:MAG TPA: thioredoxin domain-containing protein [Anaerolineales bacterium]|nr:thioredoxin domain-containing protein [Anaerolineales bacterium]
MGKEGTSKRQARREQRRRAEQRSRFWTIGVVVAVALVIAFFLIYPNVQPVGAIATAEPRTRPQVNANMAGDPNAPIKITEFADFQCPYCLRFYQNTESQVMDSYVATGKVYFVYRSYGNFIGAESKSAAEAAYCAGDQNKFWEMHDILFANQKAENSGDFANNRLMAFAKEIGLDMTQFQSCFNGGKYDKQTDQDFADAHANNVQATPSFVLSYTVNGQPKSELIEGAVPFSDFQTKIDAALAEIGK